MNPDRWQKVKQLYEDALTRPPAERARFLDENCAADDDELRREVESLLVFADDAGTFLEKPAVGEVAELIISKNEKLTKGQRVSHYEILSELGEGGMGEVYLAKDTRLNRQVALKVLASHITKDPTRVSRFRQEAFVISALNHPNIVTIHEIGAWQDRDFIVTEFVKGATLRERLRKKTSTSESLDIVLQIASALAAAHGAGVVHRDIKPENVMVRDDGLVKVLDFGIAKYRPTEKGQKALIETEVGEIIGTAAYMSPEQARGLEVDARTDIWSLGVILYELLAGRLPFGGETKADRIAAILEREPAPLSKISGKIASQLQKVIDRTLAKDKKNRYPDMAAMAEDISLLRETTVDKLPSMRLPVRRRERSRRAYWFASAVMLALLLGAFGLWFYVLKPRGTSGSERKSIAVLPLKPINQANRDELYEIGVADSLIQRLGSMNGFVVRPLSAIRRYADVEQDPLAAGREQQVDYVLASNYQIANGKIRVTAQLLNVETGQLEETYKTEKDAGDVFAMQDAVANEIGKLLQTRFVLTSGTPSARRGTESEEAYRLYLQGVYFNDKRLPPDGEKAVEFFEQAVRVDPNYARAWAGVAFAHRSLIDIGADVDYGEQHRISMEAVKKALALDPNLSEAYNALCINKLNYEYDVDGAEAACKRAIELDPNSPLAHNTYARLLFSSQRKRFDEAIAEIKTAIDLDPTSLYHQIVYVVALTFARRYDEAIRQLERVAQRYPRRAVGDFWLVGGVALQGKEAEDFDRLTRFEKLAETDEETNRIYRTAYQTGGWQSVLREQAKISAYRNPTFYVTACVYGQMGDKDKALEYLEKTYRHREHWMAYLRVDPRFDSLRGDPRFEDLIRRVETK